LPSPFQSPVTTELGLPVVAIMLCCLNVPLPTPSRTLAEFVSGVGDDDIRVAVPIEVGGRQSKAVPSLLCR